MILGVGYFCYQQIVVNPEPDKILVSNDDILLQLSDGTTQNISDKGFAKIIDSAGNILIADKVVFLPNSVIVLDYKTGEKRKKHIKQVMEYTNAFLQMGYPTVKGLLFYTQQGELITV